MKSIKILQTSPQGVLFNIFMDMLPMQLSKNVSNFLRSIVC